MRGDGLEFGGRDWGRGDGWGDLTWLLREVESWWPCKCGDWDIGC